MTARLRQAGPLLGDHPNVRAVVVCGTCGQRWLYDLLDNIEWGGEGAARAIYAKLPDALAEEACGALTTGEVETLRPRLVIHDYTTNRIDRVA